MKSFLRLIDQKKLAVLGLLLSDLIFFLISFFVAYYFRNFISEPIQSIQVYLQALPSAFILMVIVFYFFGLYEQKIRIEGTSEMFTVIKAVLMTSMVFMTASFLYKYDYSRGFIIILIFAVLIFVNFGRLLIRVVKKALIKRGIGIVNVLIVGAGEPAKKLAAELERYKNFGYSLVGFVDGNTENLNKIIREKTIGIVFVSDPNMPHEKILTLITECEDLNVKFKLVSNLYEILAGNIDISEIEGIPAIDLKTRKKSVLYLFVKRFLDILFSFVGLIILLPIWCLIILLIRIDSKGKTIFTQERVGKDGRIFKMYKFRTMFKETGVYEEAPRSADDKRITRVGKFLRRTSLDELPQIINILKGEMSLVGPRPEMPFIVEKYTKWQRKRLEAKPGLTGLWQILGRKDLPLHENIEYDFYYIQNQSLLLDLVIMIKTVWTVITGKGAF